MEKLLICQSIIVLQRDLTHAVEVYEKLNTTNLGVFVKPNLYILWFNKAVVKRGTTFTEPSIVLLKGLNFSTARRFSRLRSKSALRHSHFFTWRKAITSKKVPSWQLMYAFKDFHDFFVQIRKKKWSLLNVPPHILIW